MNAILNTINQFAQSTPDSIAIEGDELHLSYRALQNEAIKLSDHFKRQQIRCLALLMDNSPAWVVFDLAAQMADTTLIPLPPFFTPEQIHHTLADAAVDTLITDQSVLISKLFPAARPRPIQKVAGKSCWQATLTESATRKPELNGIAKVTYTSGTTGAPKGVCLTQEAMNNVSISLKQAIGVNARDRHLCLLPLAVLLENTGGVYTTLLAGGCCIIPSLSKTGISGATKLDPELMANAIRAADASTLILLPQMLQALITEVRATMPLPQRLRFIAVGGAPVARTLLEQAAAINLPVFEGYGLSECASVIAVNTPASQRLGSVGKLLPHTQIRFNHDGEILLAGNLFSGYLNHAARGGRWYASGDLGYLDSDGFLYLTGRKKNCFITSFGRNVAPEWVEKELTVQPAIAQAALFGEAQPYNVAVITPEAGTSQSDAQIDAAIAAANRQLPDYAQVSAWLLADEPFSIANQQLTATGRVRHEAVWEHYGERINQYYRQQGSHTRLINNRKEATCHSLMT